MGIIKISGCPTSSDAMEAVAVNEFNDIGLTSEPEFIGSAGDGTPVDFILSFYGQNAAQDLWEYYKAPLLEKPGSVLKVWLHWNGQEFDAYLKCSTDHKGDSGFTTHDMPYIQT